MRLVVTRIHVWPAAKVGALLGCLSGFLIGIAIVLIGSTLAPLGQLLDRPVNGIGFSGVVLISLANGALWCSAFAAGAALYNMAALWGAHLILTAKSSEEETRSNQETSAVRTDSSALDNCSFATKTFEDGPRQHTP
ncbi:MAG: hypothetical protein BWY20_01293 [Spirochaetes bacterium ADurb.Bin215]|nr:MAG: hypothetical protein BWY20_01293 [Spirochaetes bacterium ADurb.Bin215]